MRLKRYHLPFDDGGYRWFVFEEDAQAALDVKLAPEIKTALCGEIRDLHEQVHALNNKLTALTLERDALKRAITEHNTNSPSTCPEIRV